MIWVPLFAQIAQYVELQCMMKTTLAVDQCFPKHAQMLTCCKDTEVIGQNLIMFFVMLYI